MFLFTVDHLPSVRHNAGFFVSVAVSNKLTWRVLKAQLNVLSEPTAVVIHDSLGIPEHLQKRVHLFKSTKYVAAMEKIEIPYIQEHIHRSKSNTSKSDSSTLWLSLLNNAIYGGIVRMTKALHTPKYNRAGIICRIIETLKERQGSDLAQKWIFTLMAFYLWRTGPFVPGITPWRAELHC